MGSFFSLHSIRTSIPLLTHSIRSPPKNIQISNVYLIFACNIKYNNLFTNKREIILYDIDSDSILSLVPPFNYNKINITFRCTSNNKEKLNLFLHKLILMNFRPFPNDIPKRESIPKNIKLLLDQTKPKICPSCARKINSNYDCSHILAYSHGGENSLQNLVVLCSTCNRSSKSQLIPEFVSFSNFEAIDQIKMKDYILMINEYNKLLVVLDEFRNNIDNIDYVYSIVKNKYISIYDRIQFLNSLIM